MSDSRILIVTMALAAFVWVFGYLFDRHMIGLIKQALDEREREKSGNSRA